MNLRASQGVGARGGSVCSQEEVLSGAEKGFWVSRRQVHYYLEGLMQEGRAILSPKHSQDGGIQASADGRAAWRCPGCRGKYIVNVNSIVTSSY